MPLLNISEASEAWWSPCQTSLKLHSSTGLLENKAGTWVWTQSCQEHIVQNQARPHSPEADLRHELQKHEHPKPVCGFIATLPISTGASNSLPPEVNPLQLATLGRCSRPAFGQPHWHLLFCEPWQSKPCNSHSNCGLHKSRMKIKWLNQPKESVRSGPKKKSFTTVVSRPLSIWELAWLLADRSRRIDRERFQRQCDRHDAIPPPHLRTQLGANWTHYDIQNINSSAASARALGWVLRANDCS